MIMTATLLAAGTNDALLLILMIVGPLMAVYGVLQLVSDLRGAGKKKISDRLKTRAKAGSSVAVTMEDLRKQAPKAEGKLAQAVNTIQMVTRLQTILEQANVNYSAPQLLINLTLAGIVICAVILAFGLPLYVAAPSGLVAYILPLFLLFYRRKRRMQKMVLQLPDVFELLSQALRAGHSLASGMQLVARELPEPAGTEFGRVFHEHNLGLKLEDALQNFANRMDILDVRFFVTAVLIQRQTGGDLAEVLDKISSVIRDRIKLFGTVQALTAEGRLSGYILLALPVVVFLAMLKINYDYAAVLLVHPTGQMLAMTAAVMMIAGWVMIKWIVNIKV